MIVGSLLTALCFNMSTRKLQEIFFDIHLSSCSDITGEAIQYFYPNSVEAFGALRETVRLVGWVHYQGSQGSSPNISRESRLTILSLRFLAFLYYRVSVWQRNASDSYAEHARDANSSRSSVSPANSVSSSSSGYSGSPRATKDDTATVSIKSSRMAFP